MPQKMAVLLLRGMVMVVVQSSWLAELELLEDVGPGGSEIEQSQQIEKHEALLQGGVQIRCGCR